LKADFDNYRKRVLRQQDEQAARAAGALVAKLLPVIDNLDLAWAHLGLVGDADVSEEARALAQARSQLLDVLAREGLERVDEVGVPFDPVVHDAVAHSPAPAAAAPEHAPGPDASGAKESGPQGGDAAGGGGTGADGQASGQVVEAEAPAAGPSAGYGASVEEVMRAGYRWRGQVLRPAMVRVRG
jgi:molecular chaperone GrpE (heat shock protein)